MKTTVSIYQEAAEREYWLLAPGQGAVLWDAWYEREIGGLGWNDMGNLRKYESKQAMVEYMPDLCPNDGPKAVAPMLWEFSQVMKPGDVVFAKLGLHKVCGWGVVRSDYRYDESQEPFYNLRDIDWKNAFEIKMPLGVQLPLKTLTRMFTEFFRKANATDETLAEIRSRMKQLNQMIASDESNLGRGYRIGHSFFVPNDGREADAA